MRKSGTWGVLFREVSSVQGCPYTSIIDVQPMMVSIPTLCSWDAMCINPKYFHGIDSSINRIVRKRIFDTSYT